MTGLRSFMFERVYLGPAAEAERSGPRPPCGASSTTWRSTPTSCRPIGRATCRQRLTDYVAGMTDRFALAWP